ncbi:uncharacterized protein A4U43_C01F9390 [Asparagus officinalis]|uniref:Bulb-type lectin domain-containing protein n=1 Tax=Asparagus officinalis TaxID=4686 RepID=A0A5P1FNM9_ASPOF|nr:uncharacterized protein A4U43_C01F9390 [Asparagus officinalis]
MEATPSIISQRPCSLKMAGFPSKITQASNEIWNAGVNGATSAAMLDTGNFVLSSSKSGILWQTFHNPTDTILPGQTLNKGTSMYAKLTDDDYSPGRFKLKFQDDGNLALIPRAYPSAFEYDSYWFTQGSDSGSNKLVFNESTRSLYLSYPSGGVISVFSAPALGGGGAGGGYYLRATVDTDGVFRQYSFPKGSTNSDWTVTNQVAEDICTISFETFSGPCGFNSYCSNPDSQEKTHCLCPPNYSFINPNLKFKGCKPNFTPQPCEPNNKTQFHFATLNNVDWPLSDAEQYSPMTELQCINECLNDCFCLVAIYADDYNNGTCWKKKFPLSNGRMGSGVDRKAFVKYSVENPHKL